MSGESDDLEAGVATLAASLLGEDQLAPETAFDTLATWDSLVRLNLLLGLEEEFGITTQPEDVDALTSVQATAALVRARR